MSVTRLALPILVLAACAEDPAAQPIDLLPAEPIPTQGGSLPGGAGGLVSISLAGAFNFTGPTAPGTAGVAQAPVIAGDGFVPGDGDFDLTVAGIHYQESAGLGVAMVSTDSSNGVTYGVWAAFQESDDPASGVTTQTAVQVIVPADDMVAGTTVALDGDQRVALFVSGDAAQDEPSSVGAAVSGTVTFTAGSATVGSRLTASIAADFGPVELVGDPGPGGEGNYLVAGDYLLSFVGPAEIACDGELAGQEADYAGVSLVGLGFGSGAVSLEVPSASAASLAGPAIQAGFTSSPLALLCDDANPGICWAALEEDLAGPSGSTEIGRYIALDAAGATASGTLGGAGAVFGVAGSDGTCSVAFGVSLSAL